MRQVVALVLVDEFVHLGHKEVLVVLLIIWLLSASVLPLWLGCAAFLRVVLTVSRLLDAAIVAAMSSWLLMIGQHLVLLGVLLLIFGLVAFVGLCNPLALSILLLDVGDESLFRLIVHVGVNHSIDCLEVVVCAQWSPILLTPPMRLLIHVVVRLLVARGEQLTRS